jgi:hypothetical protein
MTETAKLPMTGSAGRPLKMAEYLAEAERLRETVDAYRRARGSGADDVASKPEHRRLPPLPRPTEIEGYPLNSTPPAEIRCSTPPHPSNRRSHGDGHSER